MTQTVFITGASSGIGRATAHHFHQRGWNVVASMRSPDKAGDLADSERLLVTRLDVLDAASIASARDAAFERFGRVDVLVNNAGYGAYGPLEAFTMERIERQFDTNVIGLLAVTKAFLPDFRARRAGVIVNISSIGGRMTFPLGTLYHGTKFAVEGLSEALHYELEAFGVRVKIVEPGMIKTNFGGRSFDFCNDASMAEYQGTVQKLFAYWGEIGSSPSEPSLVADVIWAAAHDETDTLRFRAGADAEALLTNREQQDDATFIGDLKAQIGLGSA
ncbi:MAG: SDR family oxidoreductase [Myxococcales bacterium]|nr:SDR family oxidoreductase [Myxococcales bacterium]MCB9536793.1 SDR family oxidoreductase [Myxococcales bacterium]